MLSAEITKYVIEEIDNFRLYLLQQYLYIQLGMTKSVVIVAIYPVTINHKKLIGIELKETGGYLLSSIYFDVNSKIIMPGSLPFDISEHDLIVIKTVMSTVLGITLNLPKIKLREDSIIKNSFNNILRGVLKGSVYGPVGKITESAGELC